MPTTTQMLPMFKKILIPTDGSPLSTESAVAAMALAKALSASVVGFYACPPYRLQPFEDFPGISPENEFDERCKRNAENFLGALAEIARESGVKFVGHTLTTEQPAVGIVEAANNTLCDLICIGSHGYGGLTQLFLGSVTTKVLSLCDIPVLVYRKAKSPARDKL